MNLKPALLPLIFGLSLALLGILSLSLLAKAANLEANTASFPLTPLNEVSKISPQTALGQLPLRFIPNRGQTDPAVAFHVQSLGGNLFFGPQEVVFSLPAPMEAVKRPGGKEVESELFTLYPIHQPHIINSQRSIVTHQAVIHLTFDGATPSPTIEGLTPLPGGVNFFTGNDPARWQNNLPTYDGIVYRDLYPGIDLVYRGLEGRLKSEFVVAPGADPQQIRLRYHGADNLSVRDDGALVIHTAGGELVEAPLLIYQEIDGVRREIVGRYLLLDDTNISHPNHTSAIVNRKSEIVNPLVAVEVAPYDPAYPLVIDPELMYSSYLGGASYDYGWDIALDDTGNIYISGETDSVNFPTHYPFQGTNFGGELDAFVTQFIKVGGVYTYGYSTYLGGSDYEFGYSIAVDSTGSVYITGETVSTDFPLRKPFQSALASQPDTFVTQIISASGAYTLGYSSYLGGSDYEVGSGIAVDRAGNAYVTGVTRSTDFPTRNAIQGWYVGSDDAFVTQIISANGVYTYGFSTYLGSGGADSASNITVDSKGNIYIIGTTASTNFPTRNAFQGTLAGSRDAFVTQIISASGGFTLGNSTYLGGSDFDEGRDIAVDYLDNVYIIGNTSSTNFPLRNAIQTDQGGRDAFVTKLVSSSGGYSLAYSTYLGGSDSNNEEGSGIAVDEAGNTYVTGVTASTDFPTHNAIQSFNGGPFYTQDVFVTQIISSSGVYTFGYSTYLGGSNNDSGFSLAVDNTSNVYITGGTNSFDFPIQNALQEGYGGGSRDAFVAKINSSPPTCFAQINSTLTTFSSAGAGAVQQAIDAAPNGDLVKVAGYCAGISSRAGMIQTIYISKPLTLRGGYTTTNWAASYPLTQPTTLDAQSAGRVSVITGSAVVTIADLTLTNGKANEGGGIRNDGTLNLTGCVVSGNMALGEDGIDGAYGTNGSPGLGGGISNNGILTISNCTISNNEARGGQGGDSSQDSGGSGGSGMGGGIYSSGNLLLNSCTLNYNKAIGGEGGAGYYISFPGRGSGGGVYGRDTMVINNSIVTGNEANSGGGIEGYILTQSEAVTVSHTLVNNNSATGLGGGIGVSCHDNCAFTLISNTISSNIAREGGGIAVTHGFFDGTVQMTLQDSTVSGNQASADGGGIFGVNQDMGSNVLTLTNSTISGNRANNQGGGLYFDSNEPSTNLMTLINTTVVSNNSSSGSNITAGSYIDADGTVRLRNTIIAYGLIGENCSILESGKIISEGYNLDSQNTCNLTAAGDITNTNSRLGPLQDNGGATLSHALLPGGPAIDAGTCALSTDQRGQSRPGTGSAFCDIGAFEAQGLTIDLAMVKAVTPTVATPGQTVTYTLVFSNQGTGKAGGVVITDIVPLTLTHLNVAGNVVLTQTNGGVLNYTWQIQDLAPGQQGIITLTGQVKPLSTNPITFTNIATITGSSVEANIVNNVSPVSLTIITPDLALFKTVDDNTPPAGQRITYTLVLSNSGAANATNAVISDTLPASLTLAGPVTLEGTSGTTGSPPTLASGLTIAAGQRVTVTFPVTVNAGLANGVIITNTAAVTSTEIPGPVTATVTLTIINNPAITVTKSANTGAIQPSQTITYTYYVTNTGNVSLHNLSAWDDKLGQVILNQATLPPNQSATGTLTYTVIETDLPGPLTNTVVVTGTVAGGGAITAMGEVSVTLIPPDSPNPAVYLPLIVKSN